VDDQQDLRFALERALAHAEDAIALLAPFGKLDGPPDDALAQAAVDVAGELDGFAGAVELARGRGGRRVFPELPWDLMSAVGPEALSFDDEGRAGLDPEAAVRAGAELLPAFVAAIRRALSAPARKASATPAPAPRRSRPQPRRDRRPR
jgi:hypothetical protein